MPVILMLPNWTPADAEIAIEAIDELAEFAEPISTFSNLRLEQLLDALHAASRVRPTNEVIS